MSTATLAASLPAPHADQQWQCGSCNFVYDEAQGWESDGIAPGTRWNQLPADWRCPDCSASQDDFSELAF